MQNKEVADYVSSLLEDYVSDILEKEAASILDQIKTNAAIKKNQDAQKEENQSKLKNIALPIAGGVGVTTAGQALGSLPMTKIFDMEGKQKVNSKDAEKLVKQYANLAGVKLKNVGHDGTYYGKFTGPHYNPAKRSINTGADGMIGVNKNIADFVLAHEVGHAKDYQKAPLKAHGRDFLGGVAPAAAGVGITALNRQHIRDKIRRLDKGNENGKWNKAMNFVEKHPYAVGAGLGALAGMSTVVPREAVADINAYKIMKQTMPKGEALRKALKGSALQLSNYALNSGATGAASGMLAAGAQRHHEKMKALREKHDQSGNKPGAKLLQKSAFELHTDSTLPLASRGATIGGSAGLVIGNAIAEKNSQRARLKTFGAPPRLKDFDTEDAYLKAKKDYDHRIATTPLKEDSLKRYLGTTGKGLAIGSAAGAGAGALFGNYLGHIINKTAGKITEKDDLTKEDVHDRYKGYDTSEAVGNRKLKYQLGGAALGATVTPAVLGGLAYLAKHKLNRDVDPRAFAQSGFTTGVGTGFMLGGMAAKAKQADRDRKVLEDRYKNDPKTLAMAQDHGIAMAEALRDLKKKAEELEVLLEKQAETIKMEPKAGDALSNKPSKQIVAELVKKETESPSGQYA